ncbi:MAG: D-alanine--D-alanine ligase [Deltaproteobacteria bacterium]|nr:D-alanine--D-alanine ligase [Deltaproteobacteria bacterium]
MKDKEIGILLGGVSAERDISLKTGEAMFQALKARGYRVQKVFVDADIDRVLRQTTLDVAVIALHGTYGEDGCIQGTLETMGIPYTGSGVLPSALAMDKLKSKELFRLYNVPTPSYYVVRSSDLDRLEQIHSSFGFPSFVKPRSGGSSVGAGGAKNLAELKQRCEDAARFDEWVLVERLIRGREVAFPARLSPTRYQGVLNLAERSVQAVGATGATRVDLLVTSDENEYVLEVNTLPGMTPTSLLPKIAAGAGYDFGDLCEAILERAALHVGEGLPSVSEAERAALTADRLPLGPAE